MRALALLIALWGAGGCHLIFPFEVGESPPADVGPDQLVQTDGRPDSRGLGDAEPGADGSKPPPVDAAPKPDSVAPLSWKTMSSPVTSALFGVWGRSSSDVYAAGEKGVVLHYDGSGWSELTWPSGKPLADFYVVRGSGSSYVYVAGYPSAIRRCTKATCDLPPFQDANLPLKYYLRGLWCESYNRCYIAGHDGVSIPGFFADDGITNDAGQWPEVCKGAVGYAGQRLYSVWGRSWTDVVITGTAGTVLHLTGTGCAKVSTLTSTAILFASWAPPGKGLSGLIVVGSPVVIPPLSAQGVIMRHDGTGWQLIPSNAAATLTGVWGRGPGDVVVVGTAGTVLHLTGQKATKQATLTGQALNAVWGDAGGYFAVGYGGVILHGT